MEVSSFIIYMLKSTIAMLFPLLLPSLGEAISERSGVLNIGIDSYMLMGALCAYYGTYFTGSLLVGILAGMAGGGLLSLVHAILSISIKANQIICGIGIWLFGLGFTSYVFRLVPIRDTIEGFSELRLGFLSDLPVVGKILFQQNILVYFGLVLVILCYLFLYRTPVGLMLRATGDNPMAVDMAGHNVYAMRYLGTLVGGVLAGLGGAYLVLSVLHQFSENMTAGRGFICLCIVIFGNWNPARILLGAILFAGIDAFQLRMQPISDIPFPFFLMLPYVLTLIVLVGLIGKVSDPVKLMVPYRKGED